MYMYIYIYIYIYIIYNVLSDVAVSNEETEKEDNQCDQNTAKIIMSKAAALVRESNSLPRCGDNFELLNSYSLFTQFMEQQESRICNILIYFVDPVFSNYLFVNNLMGDLSVNKMVLNSGCSLKLPKNISDLDGYMEKIVQADDRLIERVGVLMDVLERAGRNEEVCVPKTIIGAESTKRTNEMNTVTAMKTFSENIGSALAARLRAAHEESLANKTVASPKPQKVYGFDAAIDNSRKPFVSKLRIKHNMKERKYPEGLTIIDDDEDKERG
uniref:PMC2NT domain-containing protein n=1 Tax=Heterorhabditis bacteriophora TaxID=37862 RepID=A0A1I7X1J3_HETBA